LSVLYVEYVIIMFLEDDIYDWLLLLMMNTMLIIMKVIHTQTCKNDGEIDGDHMYEK